MEAPWAVLGTAERAPELQHPALGLWAWLTPHSPLFCSGFKEAAPAPGSPVQPGVWAAGRGWGLMSRVRPEELLGAG